MFKLVWFVLLYPLVWLWLESLCWLSAFFFFQWNGLNMQVCVCVFHLRSDPFSVSRVCYLIHCDLLFNSSLFILLFKYSDSFPASPLLFSFTEYFNLVHLITWNPDLTEQRAELLREAERNVTALPSLSSQFVCGFEKEVMLFNAHNVKGLHFEHLFWPFVLQSH